MTIACPAAAILMGLLSSMAGTAQQLEPRTITSNLEYRISRGDLPKLSFGVERPKNVEVMDGNAELLQSCLNDPVTWSQDPLLFRLAHTHAMSIQSCRENRSPSMHVIFRKVGDEPLRAWAHFDGHGAQTLGSRMAHLGEMLYHKIRFKNNDQELMFENLERSFSSTPGKVSDATNPLTTRERFTLFTDKTLTRVQPYASSLISSAVLLLVNPSPVWGRGTDGYTNHLVASFTQRLVTYGMQSGAALALGEDLRYRPSLSRSPWKRSGHALFSTLVSKTPRGNDIAFANLVAAFGSATVIHVTHPGREDSIGPGIWSLSAQNLLGFAEGNLWNEFKPDLKHLLQTRLHRRH